MYRAVRLSIYFWKDLQRKLRSILLGDSFHKSKESFRLFFCCLECFLINKGDFVLKNFIKRLNTVRVKLIAVPLILLSIAILALAVATYSLVERNMIHEMQNLGFDLVEQAMHRLEDNSEALSTVEQMVEERIIGVGRTVITNQDLLSNEYLTQLATDMEVDVINWFDRNLQVTHSAFELEVGWVAPADNSVAQFSASGQREWAEEIRQAEGLADYYKYGYVRGPRGEFVQVGMLANAVQELTDKFSYQNLVEELAATDEIVFAAIINKDRVGIAHSNPERIGVTFDDEGTIAAAQRGESYASQYFYEAEEADVYDILLPVILDGEHVGAINIGMSMAEVEAAIEEILNRIILIGTLAFLLLGTVLLFVSFGIINSLKVNQNQLNNMAQGDFSQEIPAKFLNKEDELGEMARAVAHTQESIKKVLTEMSQASLEVAGTSQQLSASTEETSASIQEIASTSNQFASTVEQMNSNSQVMVESANQILAATTAGSEGVTDAISSTEELKNQMQEIALTVESLGKQSHEISEIVEVITGIAEQTNLLALNAAIEAARAGEHGRGFAVVADEVRNLAEQSAGSTTRITNLIQNIQAETERTIAGIDQGANQAEKNAEIVSETGNLMAEIIDSINNIIAQIEGVSLGITEINLGSHEMAATTEEQSASIDSVAQAAQNLSNMSEHLQQLVAQFKLD